MLQAIRGQLQAVAALRDTAATCDAQHQRLLEDTVAALSEITELADQQADLSCLRQACASQERKLTEQRTQLQVHCTALNPCMMGVPRSATKAADHAGGRCSYRTCVGTHGCDNCDNMCNSHPQSENVAVMLVQADVEALRTCLLAETDSFSTRSSEFQCAWSAEVRTLANTTSIEAEVAHAERSLGAGSGSLGS